MGCKYAAPWQQQTLCALYERKRAGKMCPLVRTRVKGVYSLHSSNDWLLPYSRNSIVSSSVWADYGRLLLCDAPLPRATSTDDRRLMLIRIPVFKCLPLKAAAFRHFTFLNKGKVSVHLIWDLTCNLSEIDASVKILGKLLRIWQSWKLWTSQKYKKFKKKFVTYL